MVVMTETRTVAIEQTEPSMNEPTTQYGMPASVAPVMKDWKTNSETLASVMPKPVKKLCARKPLASCCGGSLSATKEQADAATDRADEEERLAPAPPRAPRPVGQRTDDRLDQQARDRAGQVEDRQVVRVRPEEGVDRVHSGLLHPEAVLDAEEAQVHEQDLAHVHQRLLPHP